MLTDTKLRNLKPWDKLYKVNDREGLYVGVASENGIYGHSRFCNTDFDDKLACLNLSGV
nr:Arm DNA-binding domain-containing protein [Escherichia coli]